MTPKALSREIKFRVYSTKLKEMVDWDVLKTKTDLGSVFSYEYESVIPMQFTGLHDKNGKEIYEGDIVKWHDNIENIDKGWSRTAIVNINPDLYFHCFDIGGKEHNHDFHYGNFIWKETDKYFEIIGNIYE